MYELFSCSIKLAQEKATSISKQNDTSKAVSHIDIISDTNP